MKEYTTKEKIDLINNESVILGQTMKVMLNKFKNIETKLSTIEQVQKKFRNVSESLLQSLIKTKEKESLYEKIMNMVLNFLK